MRAVALGGGHGLQGTLAALRRITDLVSAVVTVADDGGSSGRLRRELGVLPPGDLRQAIVTLAGADTPDGTSLWGEVFQHRFGGDGALAGHAVGNLLLAGLLEVLGDPVRSLDAACALLGVRGRVLPMCEDPLDIEADVTGLDSDPAAVRRIRGQVAVATTPGSVQRVRLHALGRVGEQPVACAAAVQAVLEADLVLLGPGSWFTSVLPHLLVPRLHDALVSTTARKAVILNLVPQPGETAGFSPEQHLRVLRAHAPELHLHAVIADKQSVVATGDLHNAATAMGARLLLDRIASAHAVDRHDPTALAGCLLQLLGP
ncbi:MAG: gluconeogenesis factor YvcK family protein [Sciscionella sp.]